MMPDSDSTAAVPAGLNASSGTHSGDGSSGNGLVRTVFAMLMLLSLAVCAARIVGAERIYEPSLFRSDRPDGYRQNDPDPPPRSWPKLRPEPSPMFSSNDRSRWATVRALVDEGRFSIGQRIPDASKPSGYRDEGIIFEDDYASVDRILNPETQHFYSSKPPLLTLIVAGQYWFLKQTVGLSIVHDRWPVVVTILLVTNLLPMWGFLVLMRRLILRWSQQPWTQLVAFAVACFGMYLIPFSNTLNNHSLGMVLALAAVAPILLTPAGESLSRRSALLAGLAAGGLFTLELPALSLVVGLGVLLALRERRCVAAFAFGAFLPMLALAVSMVVATGELIPAYAKFGSEWYEYPGSHWLKLRVAGARGIDAADEPKWRYAFHLLVGHHGMFSLTPIWLLSVLGMAGAFRQAIVERFRGDWLTTIGGLMLMVSVVVIGFYIAKTNNYGGWTAGPRWLFWLTPIWLVLMLPVLDRWAGIRWRERTVLALLGISAFTVFYPLINPWRHPWLYQLCEYYYWLRY
ncbi:hypothetical protein [Tuwongella immobilis]|uniref:DUF2142 domain-containing protein n=1 Tax=Tuwongella immobilis TaxID=692036 RepID=A0A6C2YKV1_9BACT|nr:hypothetical protein [Tuwongella immobilis]VIP02004.1 Uncharacterized protein OS=Planctomyces maris DSM 8797 GN=PM8797T_23539 PE=4 SV=1 [Tuwongella immobilis]VTS00099.1 Uncharacterized protein OS=Planctomyces maris DSM 8797 GN=PM8797T_23539 PE=4 SV=1 [Tuwongella immobilis]